MLPYIQKSSINEVFVFFHVMNILVLLKSQFASSGQGEPKIIEVYLPKQNYFTHSH